MIHKRMLNLLSLCILCALALSFAGLILSDAIRFLTPLMYLPGILIGPIAIAWDLLRRGRTLPKPRFSCAIFALAVTLWHAAVMTGRPPSPVAFPPTLRLVQANVHWGGGPARTPATWNRTIDQLLAQRPDILVLNEAPQ